MRWRRTARNPEPTVDEAERLLGRWRLTVSSAGSLWVQPVGPTLRHEELAKLIERLRGSSGNGGVKEIVFDLRRVETIETPWTLVLALLIGFARSTGARCRIVSLHGQPAAVVGLYRCNCDVASLVADQKASRSATRDEPIGSK